MEKSALALGIVLMMLGVAVLIAAVFRSLGHSWGYGWYELWLLPAVGVALVILGRWLLQ